MEKISGIVITYNEEKRIEGCLKSLKPFCDEIVVVDSFSNDSTLEIASKYTARIFKRKFDTYISQKAYAASLTENNWVFCLDADERASIELINVIIMLKETGFKADAYKVNRLNYYINDFLKYCGWYPDAKIRLFDKTQGQFGGEDPHDKVVMNNGCIIKNLKKDIVHFTYRDLFHQIDKMNQFSSRIANDKMKRMPKFILSHMVFNTLIKFIKCFFFQGGFLAGTRGLINSVINSFYVFSKYAKLWEIKNAKPADTDKK